MAKDSLTAERVRERFNYDAESGIVTWRTNRRKNRVGAVVGTETGFYLKVKLDGKLYPLHRLIWLFVYGSDPRGQIDHIDGNSTHNAISNLRDVTPSVNRQNQRRPNSNNKSGFLGVTWHVRDKRWIANLRKPGTTSATEIGRFNTPEEASAAYIAAKRKFHEGCTI